MMAPMSKRITLELTYDAPLEAVAAMLGDPAFREEVCQRQHVLRHTVTVTPYAEAGKVVEIDQVQAARGLPGFATKIVGDEIRIVQRETWADAQRADVALTIPGKPGDLTGTARLEQRGATTVQVVDLTVTVGIPLLGGRIEGLVADMLTKAMRAEEQVGRDYLSR